MLKGISPVISPELIKILMEMGHGDEIVIADGNFPAAGIAQRLARADGLRISMLLDAILQIFPLDQYVEKPVALMSVVPGDSYKPIIRLILALDPEAPFSFKPRFLDTRTDRTTPWSWRLFWLRACLGLLKTDWNTPVRLTRQLRRQLTRKGRIVLGPDTTVGPRLGRA